MVIYPMQLYTQQQNSQNNDELNFLFTIRLYLNGQTSTSEAGDRCIKRGSVVSTASRRNGAEKSGRARNGPIFLRSVVNRQYKYRWLVLAITAISCMSIIVVVSVVYSNQVNVKWSVFGFELGHCNAARQNQAPLTTEPPHNFVVIELFW
ncbi:hypothetical protein HELRODRAFT_168859 [Helobdella robusta]|uniref:Uncharacterized protein n=1 Tax=Helobdella robusta TaxID=6412 RepID=T1F120_HELRO|nr:hypothetical protein HELRODRAFT_168859 [Helobdella robusta]ESO08938.1 hypothetical protein HELRODRAFT_168859 [Helobdella robusta]